MKEDLAFFLTSGGHAVKIGLRGKQLRFDIHKILNTGMSYVIPWSSIPQELQQPLRRYVAQADGKLCGYCKEDLCNTENGRVIVELYLGKQEHHVSRILY